MKIGIFDSGMGGLSVLHLAKQKLPNDEFLYYADEKNVPYGEKTKEEVMGFVDEIIQFMIDHGCEAIVIACNTATSVAASTMRKKYSIPIIGIEPAIKKAIDEDGSHRVLVIATPITVKGEKLANLINRVDPNNLVDLIALPQLVRFAERQEFEGEAVTSYLKESFAHLNLNDYSSIVLGCTHFNYFKDTLRTILPPQVKFVDGNEGTINNLIRHITTHSSSQNITYYFSGKEVTDPEAQKKLQTYLNRLDLMLTIK